MSLSMIMHAGDLEPPFGPVLLNETTGLPYNLSTATSVKVTGTRAGAAVFTARACTGNSAGQVNMPWVAGDTSTAGELHIIVLVEWTAARTQTFPSDESGTYYTVTVVA